MRIIECNSAFASLIGPEAEAAYEAKPGMKGASLKKDPTLSHLFFRASSRRRAYLKDQTFHLENKVLTASIFTIEKNHTAGGIFQDVTLPWVQKDQVIKQARTVLENSISTVQQIAFLLGENAAETEVMLNSIIDSFEPEDPGGSPDEADLFRRRLLSGKEARTVSPRRRLYDAERPRGVRG